MPRAEIATKQAKYTLDTLHAELAGKLAESQAQGKLIEQAMTHVEAVLKLLDPAYSVRRISLRRKRKNPIFKRGTVGRHVLETLRYATEPMTAHEILKAMLAKAGVLNPDRDLLRRMYGGVTHTLGKHAGGSVQQVGEGSPARWKLNP